MTDSLPGGMYLLAIVADRLSYANTVDIHEMIGPFRGSCMASHRAAHDSLTEGRLFLRPLRAAFECSL